LARPATAFQYYFIVTFPTLADEKLVQEGAVPAITGDARPARKAEGQYVRTPDPTNEPG
jgi:hypothetical protein